MGRERDRRMGNLKPQATDYYHTGKKLVFGFPSIADFLS